MSDNMAFDEFVKIAADKSEVSPSFMHDFCKDVVTQIHAGLLQDGKINIANLGKFELHQIDEKEGFNPQTKENIIIPAHNKVVFKPYKSIREAVNVPFAHMKAQPLHDQASTSPKEEHQPTDDSSSDETSENISTSAWEAPPKGADTNILGNVSTWVGAGFTLLAVTAAGAWFFLKDDD